MKTSLRQNFQTSLHWKMIPVNDFRTANDKTRKRFTFMLGAMSYHTLHNFTNTIPRSRCCCSDRSFIVSGDNRRASKARILSSMLLAVMLVNDRWPRAASRMNTLHWKHNYNNQFLVNVARPHSVGQWSKAKEKPLMTRRWILNQIRGKYNLTQVNKLQLTASK